MASDESDLLQGIIEADKTYVGGNPRYKNNRHGHGASGKTSVIGAVQREGDVKAQVTNDTKGATVLGSIEQSVETEESALITDEYAAYCNTYKSMPHAPVGRRVR